MYIKTLTGIIYLYEYFKYMLMLILVLLLVSLIFLQCGIGTLVKDLRTSSTTVCTDMRSIKLNISHSATTMSLNVTLSSLARSLSPQGCSSVDPGALPLVGHSEVSGRREGSDRRRPHDLRHGAEGGAVR